MANSRNTSGTSILLLLSLGSANYFAQAELPSISLKETSAGYQTFIDEYGRESFFHGTNVITKGFPWVAATDEFSPDISMVAEDFGIMQKLGLNVIRLGIMWPGVEPERGVYNETYLDEIEKIILTAEEYGVYTFLDMHQDCLSEYTCGEGVPYWAFQQTDDKNRVGAFPLPVAQPFTDTYAEPKANGALYPTRQDCSQNAWTSYQATKVGANAYQALYTNVNGTSDAWALMWRHVASRFKGYPQVIGLELMNEPFAGDYYQEPSIMVPYPNPKSADATLLQPVFDKLALSIREVDEDVLIFFAGTTWDDLGVGFTTPPGGAEYANRSVIAYHFYAPPQVGTEEGVAFQVQAQLKAAKRLNTAAFLTESSYVDILGMGTDEGMQSWAIWEWKSFCRESNATLESESQMGVFGSCKTGYGPVWEDGILDMTTQQEYARSYPHSVAGNTSSYSFNATTYDFKLTYAIDTTIEKATEIYINYDFFYSNGVNIAVSGNNVNEDTVSATYEDNLITVSPVGTTVEFGTLVTVSVSPQ